jgi:hypothetical protein
LHRHAAQLDRALVAVQIRDARKTALKVTIERAASIGGKLTFDVLQEELDDLPACDVRG